MMKGNVSKSVTNQILICALASLFCLGTTGCSVFNSLTSDKESKQLFKSREQYVRIVPQDAVKGKKVPPNEQPVNFDTDQIRNALGVLEIMMPGETKSTPVFSKTELDTVSKYIRQGLAEAGPEEDVTFAVIGDYRAVYGLAKVPKYTTGRVFYQDGKLNIIFGKIQEDYKSYGLYAPVDRRLDPLAPGSRSVPSEHVWTLVYHPDQTFHASNEGTRSDWVMLDLASLEARAAMEETPVRPTTSPQGFPAAQKTVEERLNTLNELLQKKLITEEEYQKKRADILKDL